MSYELRIKSSFSRLAAFVKASQSAERRIKNYALCIMHYELFITSVFLQS